MSTICARIYMCDAADPARVVLTFSKLLFVSSDASGQRILKVATSNADHLVSWQCPELGNCSRSVKEHF